MVVTDLDRSNHPGPEETLRRTVAEQPAAIVRDGASGDSRLQAASHAGASQHCSICHWLRSLRVFQTNPVKPLPRLAPSAPAVARLACAVPRLTISALPARAPPA